MRTIREKFQGTTRLIRLIIRLDRIKLPIAILSVGLLATMFVTGAQTIFEGEQEMRQGIAFLSANPAMRLFGLPTGAEYGNLLMLRTYTFITIIVGLVSSFAVVRHTRQNEELGRSELVRSGAVGRYASLSAALIVVLGSNVAIAFLVYIGLLTAADLPEPGARAMAVSIGAVGVAFSAVTALIVQLTYTSRAANSLASAAVIVAFLCSGIASVLGNLKSSGVEVDPSTIIWLSPIGWGQMLKPFAGNNWEVLLVFALFVGAVTALAFYLSAKRDVGRAVFNTKNGRQRAPASLLSPSGLVWRLQRGVFYGWFVGLSMLGAIYGLIAGDVEELLGEAEGIAEIFVAASGSSEIMLAFFGSIVSVVSVFALAYGVQAALRMRQEEVRALEFLLSTKLNRLLWIVSHVLFTVLSTFAVLTAAALSMGVVAGITTNDVAGTVWPVLVGAFVQLPAVLTIIGFVVLAFGLLPRFSVSIAWLATVAGIVLGPFVGSLLNVPDQIRNISPLTHSPVVPPLENIELLPIISMLTCAFVLFTVGVIGFYRRDITTSN